MPRKKFVNQTGGLISIPMKGSNPDMAENVVKWQRYKDGSAFEIDVDEKGLPLHPTLRVCAMADDFGIVPEDDPRNRSRPKLRGKNRRRR